MSLDNTVSNYVNSPVTWADLLPCHHSIALQQQQEEKEQLEGEISMLDDKPRMAVELVFFKQLTRKDAAKKIGVLNGYTNDSNTISIYNQPPLRLDLKVLAKIRRFVVFGILAFFRPVTLLLWVRECLCAIIPTCRIPRSITGGLFYLFN